MVRIESFGESHGALGGLGAEGEEKLAVGGRVVLMVKGLGWQPQKGG